MLDTGPSLADSLAEMEVEFVGKIAGGMKLVVLILLCYKINLNINNNTCIIIPYTICLLEFEKNKGRIAFTDWSTRVKGWMEAETPRRGSRRRRHGARRGCGDRRAKRAPDQSTGSGRKQKRRRPTSVGKTAPRSSRLRRSTLGAV